MEKKGYLYIILSAIAFGTMPLMAKYAYGYGSNATSLVFYRAIFSVLPFWILAKYVYKQDMRLTRQEIPVLIVLVLGYTMTPILLYNSYYFINSGAAMTLHFSYPLFITLIVGLGMRKGINRVERICTVLVTIGIYLMLDIDQLSNVNGSMLALLSGLTYAIYTVFLGESRLKYINTFKLCFYLTLLTSILTLIYALATDSFVASFPLPGWLLLIGFSILISLGAVVLYQMGVTKVGSKKGGLLSTLEPIVSVIIGSLFMGELLSLKEIISIILIIVSTILLVSLKDTPKALDTSLDQMIDH